MQSQNGKAPNQASSKDPISYEAPVKPATKISPNSVATKPVQKITRKKYEMCKSWTETGNCKYGERCLFAHGREEIYVAENKTAAAPVTTKP